MTTTQIFHPAAQKVLDQLDPALLDAMRRVDEAMESVRSGNGEPYAEVWADETEDPGIMYPQPGAPTQYGQEIRDTFRSYKVGGGAPVDLTTEYERIVAVDDLAFAVLIERSPARFPGAAEENELIGNVTYIYRRFGDQWKLIHRHVHGMNKFSLHTYDTCTCPACGETLLETPFKIHCMTQHGMSWPEIEKAMTSIET